MVDRADDVHLNIHSTALLFGHHDVRAVMVCYGGALALLAWAGHLGGLGWAWYAGLLTAALISLYHYRLIRSRDRATCFRAFLHNNWWGAAVFAGLLLDRTLAGFGAN